MDGVIRFGWAFWVLSYYQGWIQSQVWRGDFSNIW